MSASKVCVSEVVFYILIRGVILPAAVCGLIYVIARFTPELFRQALRSAGLAAAVAVAFVLLIGLPAGKWTGSPWGVFPALLVAAAWPLLERQAGRRIWFARYLLLSVVAVLILQPFLMATWNSMESARMIIAAATLSAFAWAVIERGSEQMHPAGSLAALTVMAGGSGAVISMEGSATLGHVAGALAAGTGIAMVLSLVGFLRPGRTEMLGAFVVALTATWIAHGFFVDTDWFGNLILLAPLAIFLARAITTKIPDKAIKDAVFCGMVAALPVGYAVFKSFQKLV